MGASQSTEIQTGSTELLKLIRTKRWKDADARARSHQEEANTWYQEKCLARSPIQVQLCGENTANEGSSDGDHQRSNAANISGVMVRLLPLHLACELNAPAHLIRTLVVIFPDAVKLKDHRNNWLPLHYCAISSDSDADRLNFILGEYPAAAASPEALGRLPLHLACEHGACADALSSLLSAFPGSARCKTKNGMLPLHFATQNRCGVDIVQKLIKAFPDGIRRRDYSGMTPIDHMNSNAHPNKQAIISLMEKALAEALRRQEQQERQRVMPIGSHLTSRTSTPLSYASSAGARSSKNSIALQVSDRYNALHVALLCSDWERAHECINKRPAYVTEWYALRDRDGVEWNRHLPIHFACERNPPFSLLKAILQVYNCSFEVNGNGSLPLHLLCEHGVSDLNVLKLLLKVYRPGAFQPDHHGMLPLHCAAWGPSEERHQNDGKYDSSLHPNAMFELLLKINFSAVRARDSCGRMPWKIAELRNNSRVHKMLARHQREPVYVPNTSNINPAATFSSMTSLSFASVKSTRGSRNKVFKALSSKKWDEVINTLQRYPDQANEWKLVQSSTDGTVLSRLLPIHLACQINPPLRVIEALLKASPESAQAKGDANALPLHSACAHGASIEVVEILLRRHPQSVFERDDNQCLPIDYTSESSHENRLDVIKALKRDVEYWKKPNPQAPHSKASPTDKSSSEENSPVVIAEGGSVKSNTPLSSSNISINENSQILVPTPVHAPPSTDVPNTLPISFAGDTNASQSHGGDRPDVEVPSRRTDEIINTRTTLPNSERSTDIMSQQQPPSYVRSSGMPRPRFQRPNIRPVEWMKRSELLKLIEKKNWNAVIGRCGDRPQEVAVWYVDRNERGEVKSRSLPIHEACKRKPSEAAVISLLSHYFEGAMEIDHNGRLPIHYACEFGAPLDVVNILHQYYPQSIERKDNLGMLPIHCSCAGNGSPQVISQLVSLYQGGLDEVDNFGRAPVTIVLEGNAANKILILEAMQTVQSSPYSDDDEAEY